MGSWQGPPTSHRNPYEGVATPSMRPLWILAVFGFLCYLLAGGFAFARQTQPDAKRVKEIQAALVEHSYEPGKNWHETQEILRGIARDHQWQTHRAPDARVLILLGLGNPHSNSDVTLEGRNHLDGPEK